MENTRSTGTPRPADDYFLARILKIAAAFNVEVSEATLAVYLEKLRQLTAEQIQRATARTIEDWDKASMMPPLVFIISRAYRQPGDEAEVEETRQITQRDDKPPDWHALGRKVGVTKEEIAQWLEEGKQEKLAHIAKLEADPQWRAMAERLGAKPSLGASVDQLAAVRNVSSKIPADLAERAPWARREAIRQGWRV